MIKRIFLLLFFLPIAVLADVCVLSKWVPYIIRPSFITALVLAASFELSLWEAIGTGILGGMMEDILCAEAVGLTSSLLMTVIALTGIVFYKNSPKKVFVYVLLFLLAFFAQTGFSLFSVIYGAGTGVWPFWAAALGRAATTTAVTLFPLSLFKRVKEGRIRRK